jgi:tRNA 2-selenouridine synthase
MRSCALAFLVQTRIPGLTVYVLKGGYKAYRKWQYNIYCYLPINSSYSDSYDDDTASASSNPHGLLRHGKHKKMTPKQRLKRAVREASASGIGIANRQAAIARVRARDYVEVSVEQDVQRKTDTIIASLAQAEAEAEWEARFSRGPRIAILGGPTGSGKTKVLLALRDLLGEQIIDLEGLANHSGSAFGFVGHAPQPTPQQYTNNVAMQWNSLDPERWVFIEDEGPNVGRVNLPVGLYRKMRTASAVLKLDIPKDIRVEVLREDYALPEKNTRDDCNCDKSSTNVSKWLSSMIEATRTLEKRIGQVKMNSMITMLQDGDYAEFANSALEYYDGLYAKHIANEHGSANMNGNGERAASIATVTVANMERFDAEVVARQVLATLART